MVDVDFSLVKWVSAGSEFIETDPGRQRITYLNIVRRLALDFGPYTPEEVRVAIQFEQHRQKQKQKVGTSSIQRPFAFLPYSPNDTFDNIGFPLGGLYESVIVPAINVILESDANGIGLGGVATLRRKTLRIDLLPPVITSFPIQVEPGAIPELPTLKVLEPRGLADNDPFGGGVDFSSWYDEMAFDPWVHSGDRSFADPIGGHTSFSLKAPATNIWGSSRLAARMINEEPWLAHIPSEYGLKWNVQGAGPMHTWGWGFSWFQITDNQVVQSSQFVAHPDGPSWLEYMDRFENTLETIVDSGNSWATLESQERVDRGYYRDDEIHNTVSIIVPLNFTGERWRATARLRVRLEVTVLNTVTNKIDVHRRDFSTMRGINHRSESSGANSINGYITPALPRWRMPYEYVGFGITAVNYDPLPNGTYYPPIYGRVSSYKVAP